MGLLGSVSFAKEFADEVSGLSMGIPVMGQRWVLRAQSCWIGPGRDGSSLCARFAEIGNAHVNDCFYSTAMTSEKDNVEFYRSISPHM